MAGEAQPVDRYSWLIPLKAELSNLQSLSSSWSICRVPTKFLPTAKDAYNPYSPHVISIGPLHHGANNVKAMEDHKMQYMLSLLLRTWDYEMTLNACGEAILSLDRRVRACYADPINHNENGLARILLRDGLFILELLIRFSTEDVNKQHDPIFTATWMISTLQRDLALLENQIPFFVLEQLFGILATNGAARELSFSLIQLALHFFESSLNINQGTLLAVSGRHIHHLLDLIHKCFLPSSQKIERQGRGELELIPCATELSEAGIQFQKADPASNLFVVKFENGVFEIPALHICDSTDSLFRNLIAFEQCFRQSHGTGQYMTSYALLMDRLIDTRGDVEVLGRKQIIVNDLGDDEDVATLFNNICKQVVLPDFYFAGLCEQVNTYYNARWHKYKASLKRDYFKNPWTIISFIAAIVLLLLTALQTIYSVLSYTS